MCATPNPKPFCRHCRWWATSRSVATAQQFGGFTLAELDKALLPYVLKSWKTAHDKYIELGLSEERAAEQSDKDVTRELEQGFQSP